MLQSCFRLLLLTLMMPLVAFAADTPRWDSVLVEVVHLPHPVFSVEAASDSAIYIVSSKGTMKWNGVGFDVVLPGYTGPIAFERSGDSEYPVMAYCLDEDRFPPFSDWARLFNQTRPRTTVATSSDGRHWVCDGSRLFIYELVPVLEQFAAGNSTRGLATWNGALWVNTYHGLFKENQRMDQVSSVRSGPMLVHKDTLYSLGEGTIRVYGQHECVDTLLSSTEENLFSAVVYRDTIWACCEHAVGILEGRTFVPVERLGVDVNLLIVGDELWALPLEDYGGYRFVEGGFERVGFSDRRLNDVIENEDGRGYFFATDSGIVRGEVGSADLEYRTIADGLPSNSICGLFLAPTGDLWASTLGGLCRLNWENGLIETHLPFTEFNYFSRLALPDLGACYFGSMDGVFFLDPSEFSPMNNRVESQISGNPGVGFGAFLLVLMVFSALAVWMGVRAERKRRKAQIEVEEWVAKGRQMERLVFRQNLENAILSGLPGASVDSCAEALGMSSRHLLNLCQEQLGARPSEVLKEVKLATAKKQMELNPDSSLSEIAARVGYSTRYLRELLGDSE